MNYKPSIFATGLFCMDIIKPFTIHNDVRQMRFEDFDDASFETQDIRFVQNGGTSANVTFALANAGWKTEIVLPNYKEWTAPFFIKNISDNRTDILSFGNGGDIPRILIEIDNKGQPHHSLRCPKCGSDLFKLKLPSLSFAKKANVDFKQFGFFFHDRIRDGAKFFAKQAQEAGCLLFYEPNMVRKPSTFMRHATKCDIVKFSGSRISNSVAEKLRSNENGNLKMIFQTDGREGSRYSVRAQHGRMSDWIRIPPFVDGIMQNTSGAGDWTSAAIMQTICNCGLPSYNNHNEWDSSLTDIAKDWLEKCADGIGAQGSMLKYQEFVVNGYKYASPYAEGIALAMEESDCCPVCLRAN